MQPRDAAGVGPVRSKVARARLEFASRISWISSSDGSAISFLSATGSMFANHAALSKDGPLAIRSMSLSGFRFIARAQRDDLGALASAVAGPFVEKLAALVDQASADIASSDFAIDFMPERNLGEVLVVPPSRLDPRPEAGAKTVDYDWPLAVRIAPAAPAARHATMPSRSSLRGLSPSFSCEE